MLEKRAYNWTDLVDSTTFALMFSTRWLIKPALLTIYSRCILGTSNQMSS